MKNLSKITVIMFSFLALSFFINTPLEAETFLDQQLTVEDIKNAFDISSSQMIDRNVMISFLANKVGVQPFDANQSAYFKWDKDINQPGDQPHDGFIPDPNRAALLEAAGITSASTAGGMTPEQYLTYIRIGFGDGSKPYPTVKDLMISLAINMNLVFNIRTKAIVDDKHNNRFSLHRESIAYRQIFSFIGKRYSPNKNEPGNVDPLRGVIITEAIHGAMLNEIFNYGDKSFSEYLSERVGVNPAVAVAVKHQLFGCTEALSGENYNFGLQAFLLGKVEDRSQPGEFYSAEPAMYQEIKSLSVGIWVKLDPRIPDDQHPDLTYEDIAALFNTTGSFPFDNPNDVLIDYTPPPYVFPNSVDVRGDEMMEFMVGVGNALNNFPNAPFADLIPQSDLDAMAAAVYNPEFEYHRLVIPYVYELLLGDAQIK